jgi:hypothetical protein
MCSRFEVPIPRMEASAISKSLWIWRLHSVRHERRLTHRVRLVWLEQGGPDGPDGPDDIVRLLTLRVSSSDGLGF